MIENMNNDYYQIFQDTSSDNNLINPSLYKLDEISLEYEETQEHVIDNSWISSSLNDFKLSPFYLQDNSLFIPLDIVSLEVEETNFEEREYFHYIASKNYLNVFVDHVSRNAIKNVFFLSFSYVKFSFGTK